MLLKGPLIPARDRHHYLGAIMKPSKFAHVATAVSLGTPITPQSRWLESGRRHEVVIEDADAALAESAGKLGLVFRDPVTKATHRDSIYIMNREQTEFHMVMRWLLGATLPDLQARNEFLALLADQATCRRVLESFRGMTVAITLGDKDGYRAEADPVTARYVARQQGQVLLEADTLTDLHRIAKVQGLQRSFRIITAIEVVDEDTAKANLAAFSNVVASIKKTTASESNTQADFAGSTRRSS